MWFAGGNLGACPIDLRKNENGGKGFEELLKAEYERYGGQYPVTRIIQWIATNFIESQYSLCYGLSATTKSKGEEAGTGNFTIEDGRLVPRDPGKDLGKVQQENETRVREAYYPDGDSSDINLPAPFKPNN